MLAAAVTATAAIAAAAVTITIAAIASATVPSALALAAAAGTPANRQEPDMPRAISKDAPAPSVQAVALTPRSRRRNPALRRREPLVASVRTL